MGSICAAKDGNNTYYVYRETYRVKINPEDQGKKRGSGKSAVRTKAVYLGSAERILKLVQEKREPLDITLHEFGLVAAAYQTAAEIGLQDILAKHIPGERGGLARWVYFFLTIINRLDHATSKNRMRQWLEKTILPQLMGLDTAKLNGKNFWYAADDVVSEKELKAKRQSGTPADDPFTGLPEDVFTQIETELFERIDELMGLSPAVICYDTTNFYTYIDEPKRSQLACPCHSKDGKHHLKHVGLLMAVEKTHGVPVMSRIYQANRHDSKIFSCILSDLIVTLKRLCGTDSDLVVVLDKGNNSQENFEAMTGNISWIGALVPSHHKDLIDLDLTQYQGFWKDVRYYRCRKNVMGIPCSVVLAFNSATARKQTHSLTRGIEKLKKEIIAKWDGYKKRPKVIPQGIQSLLKSSDYGTCLNISVEDGEMIIVPNNPEIQERVKRFGKNLIFSNMLDAEPGYLIETYNDKNSVEDDFHLLKDENIIRFRPIRHWTDTKIRTYAFCCVMALTLMRVMQWKVANTLYQMSPKLLKDELSDIKQSLLVYSLTETRTKITHRSAVQKRLWEVFKLDDVAARC
jgi:transposase